MTTIDTNAESAEMPEKDPNAVSVTINGRTVDAQKGELIIAAADRADEFIPRFCYHPRMSPVGMCRQCLVEVEGPRGPMMVVSCMTPVAEGQVVRTDTPQVKRAQEGIIELLLRTTHSTVLSATRAANVHCKTRHSAMVQARVVSLKRSVTTKSRLQLASLFSSTVSVASCATVAHVSQMK